MKKKQWQEATLKDVGKLCWFWEGSDVKARIGILNSIEKDINGRYFYTEIENLYLHCRPLTKEEIKEFMEKSE
ncbi:MAG: hypothetical protein J6U02_03945 [Elusimicrobia bacterium]|nr:hypothetical protein [Elusimicrobiota bacterium]